MNRSPWGWGDGWLAVGWLQYVEPKRLDRVGWAGTRNSHPAGLAKNWGYRQASTMDAQSKRWARLRNVGPAL